MRRLALSLAAAVLLARLALADPAGRSVRLLHSGPLARGITVLGWDGCGEGGRELDPGLYFLRLRTDLGVTVTRFLRTR